jgi:EAL domain-containing protein (putative c-di-GMP-specific phosphodiesterase class I)
VQSLGIEPGALCLEITETAVMRDPKGAIEQLSRLRAVGFRLALDDFGTGQSSLASLQTLPLDMVKIDRAFVAQSGQGRAHAAMVQAVVNLACNLGLDVVAEGVETLDQLSMLQALDCRYAQGYYFGRPVPAAMVEERFGVCATAA